MHKTHEMEWAGTVKYYDFEAHIESLRWVTLVLGRH